MLLNLRKKIPDEDNVLAYDSNINAINKVVHETNQTITIAPDLSFIARNAVMHPPPPALPH